MFACYDTASARSALSVCTFVAKKKVTFIPHPAYSSDLVPCDMPELKMALDGRRSNVSMMQAESWESLTKFQTLHFTKCLDEGSAFGLLYQVLKRVL